MSDSIATKILRLRNLKEDIVSVMEDAGIVVPTGVKYDELSSLLDGFSTLTEADLISIIDKSIVNLELPDSLTLIGTYAFYYCTNLALTSLPSSLTSIGNYAFYNCTSLPLTSLPAGLTSIGDYAFYNCTSLTDVTFQGTPTSIATTAFQGCANLTTINVPWASGAVAGAPWGAVNASINYNYTP